MQAKSILANDFSKNGMKGTLALVFPPLLGNPLLPSSPRCLQGFPSWCKIYHQEDVDWITIMILTCGAVCLMLPLATKYDKSWKNALSLHASHPKIWLIISTFELKLSRLFFVSKSRSRTALISDVEHPARI